MLTFKESVKAYKYSDDYYPYADKGPKIVKKLSNGLILMIVFLALAMIFNVSTLAVDHFLIRPQAQQTQTSQPIQQSQGDPASQSTQQTQSSEPMTQVQPNQADPNNTMNQTTPATGTQQVSIIGSFLSALGLQNTNFDFSSLSQQWPVYLNQFLHFLAKCCFIFTGFVAIVWVFRLIGYLVNVVKRQRSYERNVIKNDLQASHIRSRLLAIQSVHSQFAAAKHKLRSSEANDDYSARSSYEELKAFAKDFYVSINTRQQLDGKNIQTQYRLIFPLPDDFTASEQLIKRVENIHLAANKVTQGKIEFGSLEFSKDRQFVVARAWGKEEVDPYTQSNANKVFEEVKVDSQYSFPLSLLIDHQAKIDQIKDDAAQWAIRSAKVVDAMLATYKINANQVRVESGNSSGLFVYDLAFDTSLASSFEKLESSLDKAFQRTGSSVSINDKGQLLVTVPLPQSLSVPINVPTMYREAFG